MPTAPASVLWSEPAPGDDAVRERMARRSRRVAASDGWRRAARPLLRLPVFHKILIGSSLLAGLAAVTAGWLLPRFTDGGAQAPPLLLSALLLLGVLVAAPLNALLLHFALAPLRALERVVERGRSGDLDVRVRASSLADAHLRRLGDSFNRLLEHNASDRQRLRDLAARALQAQEAERRRLAAELQEQTAQELGALLLHLRAARRTADGDTRDQLLDHVRGGLVSLTEEIRRFARGLYPPVLEELGILAATEAYARALTEGSVLRVQVEGSVAAWPASGEQQLVLYRILQEVLNNVARHAHASRASVRIRVEDGVVEALVEDDGAGFDLPSTLQQEPCLGLVGMQERAAYIGGSVCVESRPGEGTRVYVHLPVGGRDADARPAPCDAERLVGV